MRDGTRSAVGRVPACPGWPPRGRFRRPPRSAGNRTRWRHRWQTAAVAELPRPRFATGVAIASCFRQIGAVFGIALLVAILGTPGHGQPLSAFHRAWAVVAATGAASAIIS